MNDQIVKGKWAEFKGEVQRAWGKLTDDDLERTKGNVKSIAGLIQQRYGQVKEDVTAKFNELAARYTDRVDHKADEAKEALRDSNERARH
ncbi:MAG TPA: CsbD family protein [Bdellovibrionales bacterium]|nr:CsbD family protein [Bdellovibrionales bacterium]